MNEVFTLNTRLTESVLLVSELRSKRERDQELMLREASRKAQLEQNLVSLERENKELKSLLQSHTAVSCLLRIVLILLFIRFVRLSNKEPIIQMKENIFNKRLIIYARKCNNSRKDIAEN